MPGREGESAQLRASEAEEQDLQAKSHQASQAQMPPPPQGFA